MSWRARLVCDACIHPCQGGGEWSYTGNVGPMICEALGVADAQDALPASTGSWHARLDGLRGDRGADLLNRILRRLEANPARFEAMNPPNGWGTYDGLLKVLSDMRDAVGEYPSHWEVHW